MFGRMIFEALGRVDGSHEERVRGRAQQLIGGLG